MKQMTLRALTSKLLILAIVFAVCLALTGCQNTSANIGTNSNTSSAVPQQSAPPKNENTGDSGTAAPALADGEYYGYLEKWNHESMTVELYEFDGWNEEYVYREYTQTGISKTLDIRNSSVVLEWPWSDDGTEIVCQSLDEALNKEIWGGGTTVKENCTMVISFTVQSGVVTNIVVLYES